MPPVRGARRRKGPDWRAAVLLLLALGVIVGLLYAAGNVLAGIGVPHLVHR